MARHKIRIFWDVLPCIVEETYLEVGGSRFSSEASILIYQSTRHHVPEDHNPSRCAQIRENLKSHITKSNIFNTRNY
jgi:hypothetical protein